MKMKYLLLLLTACLLLSGCEAKESDREQPGTEQTENTINSGISQSGDAGETRQGAGYEAYSGNWTSGGVAYQTVIGQGGVSLQLTVNGQNQVSGSLFTQQSGTERFAEITDIEGIVVDGRFSYPFSDDGWGGSGILQFEFLPDTVKITVDNYKMAEDNASGYGISGEYELQRADGAGQAGSGSVQGSESGQTSGSGQTESGQIGNMPGQAGSESGQGNVPGQTESSQAGLELTEDELQQLVYERYYMPYIDEEVLIAALAARQDYYDQSSYSGEVQKFLETVREVTDISNRVEPLYHTDLKYYSAADFADCTPLIIKIAKNEIYARRGYIFKDEDLYNYFYGQVWYQPVIAPGDFDDTVFNQYEKANLELLTGLETRS